MSLFEKIPETKEELDAVRASITGLIVFQRLGAVIGDVRLDADGNYVTSGECTNDDVSKVNARTQQDVDVVKQKIVEIDKLK